MAGRPQVHEVFADPRYRHLRAFGDYDDEAEQHNYDRTLTMQALTAIYSLRSAEKHAEAMAAQGRTMARATWGLTWATIELFVATVVLVYVTVSTGH